MAKFDLNDLYTFGLIARAGGVSAAARENGLSKATLSRSLGRIEAGAGVPLFDRVARGLRLTPVGESLLRQADEAVSLKNGLDDTLRLAETEPTGPIRVAASAMSVESIVAPALAELVRVYPAVRPEITVMAHGLDPVTDDLDVVIRVGRPSAPHLTARRVAASSLGLYAGSTAVQTIDATDPAAIERLGRIVVAFETQLESWDLSDEKGNLLSIASPPRHIVSDPIAALSLMGAGQGVALLPRLYADALLPTERIVPVLPNFQGPRIELFAAMPPKRSRMPAVRLFIDELVARARRIEI